MKAALARIGPAVVVALGAATTTAHGGFEVAVAAGVPVPIAWVYPVIGDGLALVAYSATNRLTPAGRIYAWVVVVLAAGVSGLAQAVLLASGSLAGAPEGLRFGVGAWPAVAAAIAAHLLHLLRTPQVGAPAAAYATNMETFSPPETDDEKSSHNEPAITATVAEPEPEELPSAAPDGRVVELAELLAAGCEVTGPQAAARHGVSERTGRRLLADARAHLERHPTAWSGLHLVEARAAGATP